VAVHSDEHGAPLARPGMAGQAARNHASGHPSCCQATPLDLNSPRGRSLGKPHQRRAGQYRATREPSTHPHLTRTPNKPTRMAVLSSARHPTSRLSPRLAGEGTVLTKRLTPRPLVPCGAHPPAGHTAILRHHRPTASPLARSSSAADAGGRDGQAAAGGCGRSKLDPGSGRMVPRTRVGRSARPAAAPAGRGRCRAIQRAQMMTWVPGGRRSRC
jgi:hypothetical protein